MGCMNITGSLSDVEFLDGEPQIETQRELIDRLTYSERLHAEALGAAVQEIESLRTTISRLREYAYHQPLCAYSRWIIGDFDGDDEEKPCDCGYDALIAGLEEAK